MRRRIMYFSIVVALAALAAVPFLYAEGRHMGGGHGFGFFGHLRGLKTQLNLSDAQVQQLKAIGKDLRTQNEPYRTQLRTGFVGVAQALIANPNDLAGAQTLMNQQAAAEQTMKSNTLTAASKALNILTPDQRTALADYLKTHQSDFLTRHKEPRG